MGFHYTGNVKLRAQSNGPESPVEMRSRKYLKENPIDCMIIAQAMIDSFKYERGK